MISRAFRSVFSNSGPSWRGGSWYYLGGLYTSGSVPSGPYAHDCKHEANRGYIYSHSLLSVTWHEVLGDGASVSLTFTGTRVTLYGTICNAGYNTTVDLFIDGQAMSRFEHLVSGPQRVHTPYTNTTSDIQVKYPLGEFADLSPAEHTLKAVSVGADSLFVVDYFEYERSEAVAVTSSLTTSTLVESTGTSLAGSTTKSILTSASVSGSASSISSTSTVVTTTVSLSQSTQSTAIDNSQPVVADMDVAPSDPHIVYSPPEAWSVYGSTRRATSCLDGTMSSSTVNSSLTYNFTGKRQKLLVKRLF